MNTTLTSPTTEHIQLHASKPSFFGIIRGEMLKVSRQWTTWIMAVLLMGVITLPYIITLTVSDIKTTLLNTPLDFFYARMNISLAILRAFSGIFLIILTARVIGQEYQLGTIRILLARGVGRVQLLAAKLVALAIIALIVFVVALLLNAVLVTALVGIIGGNLDGFKALNGAFWGDMRTYLLTILLNMAVTIMMAAAVTALGRSQVFGLSAALSWFPIDNFGTIFLYLAYRLTHSDSWLNVSGYLLGPILNTLPALLITYHMSTVGASPLVKVDSTQAFWVIGVYFIVFTLVAFLLTWKRDVKE